MGVIGLGVDGAAAPVTTVGSPCGALAAQSQRWMSAPGEAWGPQPAGSGVSGAQQTQASGDEAASLDAGDVHALCSGMPHRHADCAGPMANTRSAAARSVTPFRGVFAVINDMSLPV